MSSKKVRKMLSKIKKQARNPSGVKTYLKKNAIKMSTRMTWPEKEFKKILKELGITFETQKIVGNKIFDFYIPHLNLLFEVDGDYFHGNPDSYENPNRMQKKNIKNDRFKDSLALGFGYSIERVWESDLKENYELVKERLRKLLKG